MHLNAATDYLPQRSTRGATMMRYLSAAQLAERYGVNRSTIWRWVQRDVLPQPVRISEHCTRWNLEKIEELDREREAVTST